MAETVGDSKEPSLMGSSQGPHVYMLIKRKNLKTQLPNRSHKVQFPFQTSSFYHLMFFSFN